MEQKASSKPSAPRNIIPSPSHLLLMIADAEKRFDSDREQCAMKREADACKAMERAISAEVAGRQRRFYHKEQA